jgi:phage shock protein PspC (stress-responsive transcriptional regulator)
MQSAQAALPVRNDVLLGVCEALGQDFRFNPQWLRVLFAVALIWDPPVVIAAYLAAGFVVLVSRLLVPSRREAKAPEEVAPCTQDREEQALPIAA